MQTQLQPPEDRDGNNNSCPLGILEANIWIALGQRVKPGDEATDAPSDGENGGVGKISQKKQCGSATKLERGIQNHDTAWKAEPLARLGLFIAH